MKLFKTVARATAVFAVSSVLLFADAASLKKLLDERIHTAEKITELYKKGDTQKLRSVLSELKKLDAKIRAEKISDDLHEYLLFARYCIEDMEHAMHAKPDKGNINYMHELVVSLVDTDRFIEQQL
jgi:hypothetical protein